MSAETPKMLTRRAALIAAVGAAPFVALGQANAAGLPQSAVGYQTTDKDGKKCGDCKFFVAPNSCTTVAGAISPDGYCKLWVKKA